MRFAISILPLIVVAMLPASGEPLVPPPSLFRDPQFLKEFVGSYGILSDVEPKVSAEESRMLVELRELFEARRFAEAETALVRFIKEVEAPDDAKKEAGKISPAMIFVLGNLYFQADRFEDARRAFKEAIRRFPRFRRAHANLAFLYISKNKFDEALPHLQRAVELGAGSHRIFGLLGYAYLLKKNPLASENAYRQAYLLAPDNKDWKMGLAQALMMQEKLEESVSILDTLIRENPEDKQLWLQQAKAYLGMGKKMQAACNLEVMRLKGVADEASLNLLGNIYMDQGESQLALFAYIEAIDKSEKFDIDRALKSARILNDYGYPDKAAELVRRIRTDAGGALTREQGMKVILVEVGIARRAEENARVGKLLARLLEMDPTRGDVLLELARHYDRMCRDEGDSEKRRELVSDALINFQIAAESGDENTSYQALLGLGRLFVRERRFTDAVPVLQRALGLKKSDSLEQYAGRVRRAADRQRARREKKNEKRAANAAKRAAEQTDESKTKKPTK